MISEQGELALVTVTWGYLCIMSVWSVSKSYITAFLLLLVVLPCSTDCVIINGLFSKKWECAKYIRFPQ